MSASASEWHANLQLSFTRQDLDKTILSSRKHYGPLLVQKALYPEGPKVCHVTILHPPSGIAGGDILAIDVTLDQGAHALLTTPGASRWYKANGRRSAQTVVINMAEQSRLDWLPQENIFFEQTNAEVTTQLNLRTSACAIGWEITQLGSIMRPNHWDQGQVLLTTQLTLDGHPLWLDTGELCAQGQIRHSANGLDSFPVMATLWGFGPELSREQTDAIAQTLPWDDNCRAGITQMPQDNGQGLCLIRVLGQHVEDVKRLLVPLWMQLRPLLLQTQGAHLRSWKT
ncbi:MAG: urease accessory protein UreD [Burkholderiaceae bacterium]|nr:urease accessory protein UreD [Burkholderiaceae bacterium]